MSVGDLLSEAVGQLPGQCGYRVREKDIHIAPAIRPATIPGVGSAGTQTVMTGPLVETGRLLEQIVGETVSISADGMNFYMAALEQRRQTGANIVVDIRCKDKAVLPVTGTFDDARLLTVLTVLADQCGLKPVAMNGVYYITEPENAAKLQVVVNRDLFGVKSVWTNSDGK